MTEVKEEIPCCENCPNCKDYSCKMGLADFTWGITKRVGCFKHPSARVYLNKDVIDKMSDVLDEFGDNTTPYAEGYTDALIAIAALLRGDGE